MQEKNNKNCLRASLDVGLSTQRVFIIYSKYVQRTLGNCISRIKGGVLGWLSWLSVYLLILVQFMILRSGDPSPTLGSALGMEPA